MSRLLEMHNVLYGVMLKKKKNRGFLLLLFLYLKESEKTVKVLE